MPRGSLLQIEITQQVRKEVVKFFLVSIFFLVKCLVYIRKIKGERIKKSLKAKWREFHQVSLNKKNSLEKIPYFLHMFMSYKERPLNMLLGRLRLRFKSLIIHCNIFLLKSEVSSHVPDTFLNKLLLFLKDGNYHKF